MIRFLCTRDDGLCMRLNTLLDTAVLAGVFSGDYVFCWDESPTPAIDQQTTGNALQVFSPAFLARHRIDDTRVPAGTLSLRAFRNLVGTDGTGLDSLSADITVLVDRPLNIPALFPFLGPSWQPDYRRLFDSFGFSDPVRHAIAAAGDVQMAGNATAIHLRGGDVIHGTHSHMATYLDKALSLPEIMVLTSRLKRKGAEIWLVGQETDVQTWLVHNVGGLRALGLTDPRPNLHGAGLVMFDAVLMSRMQRIIGGYSGVTQLSQRLGRADVSNVSRKTIVAARDLCDDPLAAAGFAAVSDNHKAHAYVKAALAVDPDAWDETHLAVARLARGYRPDSRFLGLMEIAILFRLGRLAEAEAACLDWFATTLAANLDPALPYAFLTGGSHFFPTGPLRPLTGFRDASYPGLSLLAAISRLYALDGAAPSAETAQDLRESLARITVDPALVAIVLDQMRAGSGR